MATQIYDESDPEVRSGEYDVFGYKPGERARIAKAKARVASFTAKGSPMAKDQPLPGIDSPIQELEDIAAAYADVRDRRMALNTEEADLKAQAMKLMHKFDKSIYRRNGVEIRLIDGEEDLKVRVKKPAEENGADATDAG